MFAQSPLSIQPGTMAAVEATMATPPSLLHTAVCLVPLTTQQNSDEVKQNAPKIPVAGYLK